MDPIEFDGVVKTFGHRTVLDDLSFTVPAGTVVGLLGPNGAGKSTAMRVLLGLQSATRGQARILGQTAGFRGFRDAVRKVGAIIESPPLYRNATAMQNLKIRAEALRLPGGDHELLPVPESVGLADRADDRVGSFSLGMRQRVGIALALLGDPSIVILDEPTNGLDPQGAVEVREVVRALPKRGATTLLCTHRLPEVEATCDYVVVLQQGRLITEGPLQEILAGAGTGLAVTVAPEQVERTVSLLRGLDLGDVRLEGDEIVTTVAPADPSVVTRRLADEGIYLSELRVRKATLEQAFLALTGAAEQEAVAS